MDSEQNIPRRPKAIPITPVTFKLTEKDIRRYWDEIINFPLDDERKILEKIPDKLKSMVTVRTFSTFILDLVEDVELLYTALAKKVKIPILTRRMILFALNSFIEMEDEIRDKIDVLGYVDDAVIVRWVVNEILEDNPEILAVKK